MCENDQKPELEPEKESSGAGAALVKNKSSGAGAMFMKRRVPEPELCHFLDGSASMK